MIVKYVSWGRRQTATTESSSSSSSAAGCIGILWNIVICCTNDGSRGMTWWGHSNSWQWHGSGWVQSARLIPTGQGTPWCTKECSRLVPAFICFSEAFLPSMWKKFSSRVTRPVTPRDWTPLKSKRNCRRGIYFFRYSKDSFEGNSIL